MQIMLSNTKLLSAFFRDAFDRCYHRYYVKSHLSLRHMLEKSSHLLFSKWIFKQDVTSDIALMQELISM